MASSNGSGPGGTPPGGRNGRGDARTLSALSSRRSPRPPGAMSPDQACLGCLIGVGVLVVSVALWAFIYWRYAEELKPPPTPGPPVQEEIRNRTREQPRTDGPTDQPR
ncbi:MAG TPA: hypothetical protein VM490_25260 [Armatimonadaceae bacterium]|nr:hypothetical protein [Armatimonadaceae bacterium]